MGTLKCLTLIRITGKPLQKKKKSKCLHPVSEPQRKTAWYNGICYTRERQHIAGEV